MYCAIKVNHGQIIETAEKQKAQKVEAR